MRALPSLGCRLAHDAMPLIFHERVGLESRRISPFSWRIRYALAHKGIEPEVVLTRFADVARIRALSGQDLVPIIEHDGQVVHDSWSIACHLEDRFPDRPSLFGGAVGRGAARLVNFWSFWATACDGRSTWTSYGASILVTARISVVHARHSSG